MTALYPKGRCGRYNPPKRPRQRPRPRRRPPLSSSQLLARLAPGDYIQLQTVERGSRLSAVYYGAWVLRSGSLLAHRLEKALGEEDEQARLGAPVKNPIREDQLEWLEAFESGRSVSVLTGDVLEFETRHVDQDSGRVVANYHVVKLQDVMWLRKRASTASTPRERRVY